MKNDELSELFRDIDPKQMLIVNNRNRLRMLTCPFDVMVLSDIGSLMESEIVQVESVKCTKDLVTVYIIKGRAYYYFHFEILNQPF